MFSNFSDRVLKTFDGLLSRGVLTENDVNSAMREIRVALLEADVPLNIAKDFVEKVKKKAVGEKLLKSVKPGDLVVKIVHDTLIELLSFNLKDEDFDLLLNKSPSIIFASVVLPHPDSPTSARTSPFLTVRSTPLTARKICLPRNIPREMEKLRVTFLASIITADIRPPLPFLLRQLCNDNPVSGRSQHAIRYHFDGKHR